METQSLIELRRSDALEPINDTNAHGDYTIVLKQPVVLNEGDSVVLNSSFIDTRGQLGDTLSFPENVQVTGKYLVWLQNWFENDPNKTEVQTNVFPFGSKNQGTKNLRPNGYGPFNNPGYFVMCTPPALNPAAPQKQIIGLLVNYNVDVNTGRYVEIQFSSNPTDSDENTGSFYVWIAAGKKDGKSEVLTCSILAGGIDDDQKWFKIIDPNPPFDLVNFGNQPDNTNFTLDDMQGSPVKLSGAFPNAFLPVQFPFAFTIAAGEYTPASLAQHITAMMSSDIRQVLTTTPAGSQFVQTSAADTPFVQVWGLEGVPQLLPNFTLDPYGINVLSVMDENRIFVGASETALEFDSDSNTFRFTFLHTPILDTSGNAPSLYRVLFNDNSPTDPQKPLPSWLASAHSGIAFTQLLPVSLWQDTLGFNLSTLVLDQAFAAASSIRVQDIGGFMSNTGSPIISLQPGVNITTGFESSASTLLNNGGQNFYFVNTPKTSDFTNSSLTNAIVAGPLPPQVTDTSHYLVEVSGVQMSEMVTSTTKTFSVAGVVGRYQTRGSFTEGGGGAPTTIRGGSVVLSKLHVRILNPDRTPVTDMGPLSSMYLSVVRQVQLPPPLPPVLAAQPPGLLPPPPVPGENEAPPAKKSK